MKRVFILIIFISIFIIQTGEAHDRVQSSPQKIEVHIAEKKSTIIETTKKYIEIVQSVITIVAFIIGGIWTYLLFIKKRLRFPRANVEHEISHFKLNSDFFLLHVKVKITNIGNVLLSLEKMEVRVQQVSPIHDDLSSSITINNKAKDRKTAEIMWPMLDERNSLFESKLYEIEPGERDEFSFDFILQKKLKVIEVYSYFKNIKKKNRDLGWSCTSIHELEN